MGRLVDAAKTLYHRGRKTIAKAAVGRESRSSEERERQIVAALNRDGFYVLEGYYDLARCQRLRAEIDRVLIEYEKNIWRDEVESDNRAYAAENVSPLVREYFEDPFFSRLARAYLGNDQECFFTLANKVVPKPGCKGSGGGWHRDTTNERQFKSIMYVDDVTDSTGPFELVPTSHHVRSIVGSILNSGVRFGQYQFQEDEIQRILDDCHLESRRFTAKAGTVVIADTSCLHRGSPISAGARYAITNYFFSREKIAEHRAHKKFTGYFLDASMRRPDCGSVEQAQGRVQNV
jgi:Phytanoyl-CoA dioxygenase (PhyH)